MSSLSVVLKNTTAAYLCKLSCVNISASEVVSTTKLLSWSSLIMSSTPAGMEECRKPVVFVKTNKLGRPERLLQLKSNNAETETIARRNEMYFFIRRLMWRG